MRINKHIRFYISIAFVVAAMACSHEAFSQITGNLAATVGTSEEYTYSDGMLYARPNWIVVGGDVTSTNLVGWTYYVTIYWHTSGTNGLSFRNHNTTLSTVNVVVSCSNAQNPTGSVSVIDQCRKAVLLCANSPAGTDAWYVQTATNGTSMAIPGPNHEVTSTGTYYIRSYNSCSSTWSSGYLTVNVTDIIDPQNPSVPNGLRCTNGSITLTGTPGTDSNTIRWYAASTGGSPLQTATSYNTPTLSSNTTYYVAGYNNTVGCENNGSRVAITATIVNYSGTATVTGKTRFGAGTFSLTASGAPGGGSYKWYNATPSLVSSSNPYAPSNSLAAGTEATNVYTVRAVDANSCESSASTSITLKAFAVPVVTSTEPNIVMDQPVTLDAGAGYDTYQWKNAALTSLATTRTYTTDVRDTYTVTVTKEGATANISKVIGTQFNTLNQNYVVTNTILVKDITNDSVIEDLPVEKRNQTVQYFDGLGRPMQTVNTQGSPLKNDLVVPVVYDAIGREYRKYLPVAPTTKSGWYKVDIIDGSGNYANDALSFYDTPSDGIADDDEPFSETVFEASPLNRPLKDFGAGEAWHTGNKFIEHAYLTNLHGTSSGQEKIIAWYVNGSNLPARSTALTGYVETGGYYSSKQLSIKSTKDEQGNEVREYTNKEGEVILKKVQYVSSPTLSNKDHWAQTYYVYDDLGNLRFVLPPELSKEVHANDSNTPDQTALNNWAFQYSYDARRRMITKRVPGAGEVYMVYDNRDRLVLTQDANQRTGATNAIKYWSFTKYDELNRPILTGIKDTTTTTQLTQAQMQTVVNDYYSNMTTTTWRAWGETYIGSTAGNVHGYTNKAYPVRTGGASEVNVNKYLTVTYYDNYSFHSLWSGTYTYLDEDLTETVHGVTYDQPNTENIRVIGQVTGTKIKVLDGGVTGGYTWLNSVTYYDDKYRVIQVQADNFKGGIDRVTNLLDFTGKVLETKSTHRRGVTWKDKVGTYVSGNKLISNAAGWGSSGAASTEQLAASTDGWVEITREGDGGHMIGLSDSNTDASYTSIDYAMNMNGGSNLRVYENGTQKAVISGALVDGDVLRIERTGTTITYKKNGIVVYTSLTSSTSALLVDAAFSNSNRMMSNARISFGPSQTIMREFDYDHAGRLTHTWHKLNDEDKILLAKNEYNELGQLIDKKLHSTVSNGSDAKQSVDYRYNIRGWLTSMNNAALDNDGTTNDDDGDLFGMNLAYNESLGISNDALYNGNISGITWSNYLGGGDVKQKAYTYTYDPLNRILGSTFKQKEGSWSAPSNNRFAETGFAYDMNGNITALQRNDGRSSDWMDNLSYDYGSSTARSNRLLKVTDSGDDYKGFVDGNSGGTNDYTYDDNGNLKTDLNKGISSAITYNFLNLPETINRGDNSIQYIYDAGGRKLAQVTNYTGALKQTDYAGEFQYENDELQFISHEEGRIMLSGNKTLLTHAADAVTGITAVTATLAAVTQNNETYVRATANGTTTMQGMFPVGNSIAVQAGERYRIRAKGYRAATNAVYLLIKVNGTNLDWPGARLPYQSATEAWTEQIVTIPTGGTTLEAGLAWNTVSNGHQFFLNEFEIIKLETNPDPEYQYNLKDHLGNVRLTFTTTPPPDDVYTGTLEDANSTAEAATFNPSYGTAVRVSSSLYNHTTSGAKSQRLSAANQNEVIGLTKSLRVVPGDTIDMQVYAKYTTPTATATNISSLILPALSAAFGAVSAAPGDPGVLYSSLNAIHVGPGLLQTGDNVDEDVPKAFLNYILFDDDYVPYDFGFTQISDAALETGTDIPHELLQLQAAVTQPGYLYIYLSNENDEVVDVFFDDLTITHHHGPIIQQDDYYPFGLTYNSYQRENNVKNRIKFQDQEHIDDLDLGWDSFKWRNHMPDIGRFFNVDPLAEKYVYNSPYAFSENKVIAHVELEGLESVNFMVTRFEPNKTEYRSAHQAAEHPSKPENTKFENVNTIGAKTDMSFTVDLKTGEYSVNDANDRDKNIFKKAIDAFTGETFKSEYELSVTTDDKGFSIKGSMNGVDFSMSGSISKESIEITSELNNVPNEDGAMINIGDGNKSLIPPLTIATKQGKNCFICGDGDSGKQKSVLKYTVDSENNVILDNDNKNGKSKQKTTTP